MLLVLPLPPRPPHSIDSRAAAAIIWGLVPDRIADKPTSLTAPSEVLSHAVSGPPLTALPVESLSHTDNRSLFRTQRSFVRYGIKISRPTEMHSVGEWVGGQVGGRWV